MLSYLAMHASPACIVQMIPLVSAVGQRSSMRLPSLNLTIQIAVGRPADAGFDLGASTAQPEPSGRQAPGTPGLIDLGGDDDGDEPLSQQPLAKRARHSHSPVFDLTNQVGSATARHCSCLHHSPPDWHALVHIACCVHR